LKRDGFRNVFLEYGYSTEDIEKKIQDAWVNLFESDENQRIYFEGPEDTGYFMDTGNFDVRTEGQSYAMMMSLQMNRKDIFDRVWKWTRTYMYMEKGTHEGYFAWSCKTDGTPNAQGPAPDGEEFFAMALLFASKRWGDGQGLFEYSRHAKELLKRMVHQGEEKGKYSMWDPNNYLIRFIPEVDFSDPSYHLPHFYDLFAQWGNPEDKEFWEKAAAASREYLQKACHPVTGLNPEYGDFEGKPHAWNGEHEHFYSDSYRTITNIALDAEWSGLQSWHRDIVEKMHAFFADKKPEEYDTWSIDGTPLQQGCLHPVGLIATNAVGALVAKGPDTEKALRLFWETPLRTGDRRYYDNCLYFFALLALSGNYRIYS